MEDIIMSGYVYCKKIENIDHFLTTTYKKQIYKRFSRENIDQITTVEKPTFSYSNIASFWSRNSNADIPEDILLLIERYYLFSIRQILEISEKFSYELDDKKNLGINIAKQSSAEDLSCVFHFFENKDTKYEVYIQVVKNKECKNDLISKIVNKCIGIDTISGIFFLPDLYWTIMDKDPSKDILEKMKNNIGKLKDLYEIKRQNMDANYLHIFNTLLTKLQKR